MNFLRFPDEQSWISAATEAGFYSNPGGFNLRERNADGTFVADDPATPVDEAWQSLTLIAYTHDRAIDVVGQITDLEGWHVNMQGVLPETWDEFLVEPANPYRVFA